MPSTSQDMTVLENRLALIKRYNDSVGSPGPNAKALQRLFASGLMDEYKIRGFVEQYEFIIESRRPLQRREPVKYD